VTNKQYRTQYKNAGIQSLAIVAAFTMVVVGRVESYWFPGPPDRTARPENPNCPASDEKKARLTPASG